LVDHGAEQGPVLGLEPSLIEPTPKLTESFQRRPDLCELGLIVSQAPPYFSAPIVTLVHRHPALIADLPPNGKREKKDGAIWITYMLPDQLPPSVHRSRAPTTRTASGPSRLPEQ
jgi:hypothetical protein